MTGVLSSVKAWQPRKVRLVVAVIAAASIGALVPVVASASSATAVTLWGAVPDDTPIVNTTDGNSVELGTAFKASVSGAVTGVRFWKTAANTGTHVGHLWGPDGTLLASATFTNESKSGWQSVAFSQPVTIQAGQRYIVSYHAPDGHYVQSIDYRGQSHSSQLSVVRGSSGVYSYGAAAYYPTASWHESQYWVDVLFVPGASSTPDPGASAPGASDTPSATPSPTLGGAHGHGQHSTTPSQTASPTATPTATPTTTPSSTPKPTSSSTPTPTGSSTPTSGATAPPSNDNSGSAPASSSDAGWTITASTVGLAPLGLSCSALPAYTGPSTVPAGTVISGKLITTYLDISAGNITVENSCIQPTSAWQGLPVLSTLNNVTGQVATAKDVVRDNEIDGSKLPASAAAWSTGVTGNADVIGNYIHGWGSGIAVMNSGNSLSIDVERNYVSGLVAYGDPATGGVHNDAFTVRDFSAASNPNRVLTVQNNRFDCETTSCTGSLFIQSYSGEIDNVIVQGNLLQGQGWQLGLNQLNDPYSNIKAIDNRFSGTGFGAAYVQRGPGFAQWQDNYIYSASAADGAGKAVPEP